MDKNYQPNKRQLNCLFALPYQGNMFEHTYCLKGKTLGDLNDDCEVFNEDCEKCSYYKSRRIEYPIQVDEIKFEKPTKIKSSRAGSFVKIRPCAEEYEGKTYLGLYLGNQPAWNSASYDDEDKILTVKSVCNPAIFVFELKKIIYGMESWWSVIENPEDIKDISDMDINNVWYVRLLREMEGLGQMRCLESEKK